MGARHFGRFPSIRGASLSGVALLVGVAFVACGGEDDGRPPPPGAASGSGGGSTDACQAAQAYELISITDFEGPPAVSAPGAGKGQPPLQGTALSCNSGLLAMGSSGEGGAGGQGGGSGNEGGEASTGDDVPVCGFNFNFDSNRDDCNRDPVAMEKFTCNLSTGSPWVGLEVPGGRCGVPTHAYHLEATGMGVCFNDTTGRRGWGSNFLIDFAGSTNPGGVEIDASDWEGIAFWARVGDGPSNTAISIVVGDAETSGGDYESLSPGGWSQCVTADCLNDPETGLCVTAPDTTKCDPFGAVVSLAPDWAFYAIPFAELKQKGYGQPAPGGAINPSRLSRIQISTSTGDWDFFVDDLSLYRSRP